MIDFTSAQIDFSLIAPEIALLVAAFVILSIAFMKKSAQFAPVIALVGIAVSIYFISSQWHHQVSGFYGMVTCDNFGVSFKLLFSIIAILAVLLAQKYLEAKNINKPEYYALLLFSTMGHKDSSISRTSVASPSPCCIRNEIRSPASGAASMRRFSLMRSLTFVWIRSRRPVLRSNMD